ncbi:MULTISPECIES: ribokinase [Curtobacterium]|uniref:ribokinase n=1 Tax=Curtobacterium TaxID=2034 RepID=UPI000DA969E5|nr:MULTISPECIES: ribokinase [Curtobacterium]MCS0646730.1 ribokinase [Curtobacterium flaccumfaciens pv. flaccumfaciens]MCS6524325.1 ribokinase [Curtobacterium flaccumfaciens pv. flaccumfaciens]MCS6531173.1 ribokinase [Curtobacterium flaccumfaciens pv. flaccumfaciens]NUU10921.1 ribokinase [Curtobacterium flaccumfaciens]PZE23967.1 ribokinase [Curtobacterium sp. MCLR17_055]
MTESIVVVGSLNADLVVRTARFPQPGETLQGSDLAILPGGKSANQAVAAGRLGGTVRMIGAVGDDGNGALLRDSVAAAGVDTTDVAVREGVATGTAVITVDAAGENTIVISAGANGTLTPDDVPTDVFAGAAVLGLCLEVSIDVVLAAARAAHAAGVTVLTNLSPFGAVPAELLELTDVLLVNEHEAAALGDHGVARSIVTRGGAGCVVYDGDAEPVPIDAVRVEPVDTTGCGDAFMGAVALRLAAGDTLVDAARFAVGVGAYAATKPGAQASYPTAAELEAFLRA